MRAVRPPVMKPQLGPLAPMNPARAALPPIGHGMRLGGPNEGFYTTGFRNHIEELGKLSRFFCYRTLFVLGLVREYRTGV